MDFKKQMMEYSNYINEILKEYVKMEDVPEKRLIESMRYSLLSNGKRIRPILMISAYRLFKDDYEKVIPFACAMEMVHNFSLIHDDLPAIDNDDIRHNKPTNHKMFDESTAILAGDALLNNAYIIISNELLEKSNLDNKIKAFNEFSNAVFRMIAGEYVDIDSEDKDISSEILKYMHENKTGALLKASVKIGAIMAGANNKDIEKLSVYAEKIGLAFQIKDDILSETGDQKTMGKPVKNDIKMKKSTFITIYGIEKSKNILEDLIKESINILDEYGSNSKFLKDLTLFIQSRDH